MKFLFFRKALKFQTKYFFHKLEGLQKWDIDSFGYGPQPSDYTEKKIWKLFFTWVFRNLYYQWTEHGWLGDRSSPPAMQWNDVWHCKAIQTQGPWKNSHHKLILHKLAEIHSRFQRRQEFSKISSYFITWTFKKKIQNLNFINSSLLVKHFFVPYLVKSSPTVSCKLKQQE